MNPLVDSLTFIRIFSFSSQFGASTIGPEVPLGGSRIESSSVSPRWSHPDGPCLEQTRGIFQAVPPTRSEPVRSNDPVVCVSSRVPRIPRPSHLSFSSSGSSFGPSERALQPPTQDAVSSRSAEELRFLFQQRLLGFPELLSVNCRGLLSDEPTLSWDLA